MSDELKNCPFCGREPEIQSYQFKDARYECINMLCPANGIAATLTEWNTRVDSSINDRIKIKTYLKIIGSLETKLKDLEAENARLQDDRRKGGDDYCKLMERYDDLHNENARTDDRADALAEAVDGITKHFTLWMLRRGGDGEIADIYQSLREALEAYRATP